MPGRFQVKTREVHYNWIAQRDGECCFLCHRTPDVLKKVLQIDHANDNYLDNRPGNLHLLCPSCNNAMMHLCTAEHLATIQAEIRLQGAMYVCVNSSVCSKAYKCPRAKGYASENERLINSLVNKGDGSIETKLNGMYNPVFKDAIWEKLKEGNGQWPLKDALGCGCLAAACNASTGERYLIPLVCSNGPFQVITDELTKQKHLCFRGQPSRAPGKPRGNGHHGNGHNGNGHQTAGGAFDAEPIKQASARGGES